MKDIVFVAGVHGDERAPVSALKKARIPFLLGNPAAYKKDARFIKSDLNASFGRKGGDSEAARAGELLKKIPKNSLVVDFHTTSAVTQPFAIVVDKKLVPFAATTGLSRVVLMRHNIKGGHSLIDLRKGISVESGKHGTRKSMTTTIRVVENILRGKSFPVAVYEVFGTITKRGRYANFVKHPDGFYPILAGERSYDFYGLKARRALYP